MYLPNDIIRVIHDMSTPITCSILCRVNKNYYDVIMEVAHERMKKDLYHDTIRNYHLFVLSQHKNFYHDEVRRFYYDIKLASNYLCDGHIDVDVAKLICNYKLPPINKCYDIVFNAYRCGNVEYIDFITKQICHKRHHKWHNAKLRGAIAGGHVNLVEKLWVGNEQYEQYNMYAYACGQIEVIKLFKSRGYTVNYEGLRLAMHHYKLNVVIYEYEAVKKVFLLSHILHVTIWKNNILLLKMLIDDGVKFETSDIDVAKQFGCSTEFIQLMMDNKYN